MGKTSKYVTAAALCSTIVMGGLQASSVSYAATNPTTVTAQSDVKLLDDFRKELKKQIDNREENIKLTIQLIHNISSISIFCFICDCN
ncbi:hypothetical protein ACT4UL_25230, partial [Bacillus sp. HC-TM]